MRRVGIAGSTGSIGTQALDVIASSPDRFEVVALCASGSAELVSEQAKAFRPEVVGMADAAAARNLNLPAGTELVVGDEVPEAMAARCDVMLNAVVGFAGLPFTLAALRASRRLALANKESLVAAGELVRAARRSGTGEMLPVDSEHAALHQCLAGAKSREVARLLLTASGGPFRGRTREELESVTRQQALAHPTWNMGDKVTIDSSTLMNKGLEVIEAHELFDVPYEAIEVVVHPQSLVHSMVETTDGSTMAQLSMPDMRLPIGYALGYPDRLDVAYGRIDWSEISRLDFEVPDREVFVCLELAFEAGRNGGSCAAWLNAANEVAVEAFLAERIPWLAIADVVGETLAEWDKGTLTDIDSVYSADSEARARAQVHADQMGAD
ncbi:MAG TPA: 1-deoxy-D-xylulose-5-phosphate reductoisomerase [Acidimicrobiales bacterium]|nr:1-deoxy-D-xylulose-5-phosphate reductoisomerase [Acidimicrobiales bacterium]